MAGSNKQSAHPIYIIRPSLNHILQSDSRHLIFPNEVDGLCFDFGGIPARARLALLVVQRERNVRANLM